MANRNFDQTATLITEGKLKWDRDSIVALLCTNTTFSASDKTVADLDGERRGAQPITGRLIVDGLGLGLPVAYSKASEGLEYQILIVQDTGNNDPIVLAYIDENADGSPITILRTGTLIIRPVLPSVEVPPNRPSTIGVWMTLST